MCIVAAVAAAVCSFKPENRNTFAKVYSVHLGDHLRILRRTIDYVRFPPAVVPCVER